MDAQSAGQAAQELGTVHTALHHSLRLVAGVDQIKAALARHDGEPPYSPLHTTIEQAIESAERVQSVLRAAAQGG
jgi:hypothetical protein